MSLQQYPILSALYEELVRLHVREAIRVAPTVDPDRFFRRWAGSKDDLMLTPEQKLVVRVLFHAYIDGTRDVPEAKILEASGSKAARLRDLFRNSAAWNRLIIKGEKRGSYSLCDFPDFDEEGEPGDAT